MREHLIPRFNGNLATRYGKENEELQHNGACGYYMQVQMGMFCTGLERCKLLVWAPSEQDFQIQLLERKMSRLRGEVNMEEKHVLEKKAQDLSQSLEEKKRTATQEAPAEKRGLTTKIEELHLFNDTSDNELKKLRLKKQPLIASDLYNTMVEDNILKLKIKSLQDLL
ncbi:hypothetical protein J4Q44_G00184460 [Coregonus suidteri]|uniref:Coiled-coil domain-containing protein 39 n=1 Tax=Coregonus suidteri TaxID=861788 RepID=A0AAN8LTY9_9TELE